METRRSVRIQKFLIDQLVHDEVLEHKKATDAARSARSQGLPISIYLTQNNILDSHKIATAISRCFELPLYDLNNHDINLIPKEFLKYDFVKKQYALPIFKRGDKLIIGIVEPDIRELRNISFLTCMNVEFILVEVDKIKKMIEAVLGDTDFEAEVYTEANTKEFVDSLSEDSSPEEDDLEIATVEEEESDEVITADDINETPVVRFVNKILIDAIKSNSSDIHFEPFEKTCRVRYRQDGILHEIVNSPKKMTNSIVARLKVMANLDISEHRRPQDGRFRLIIAEGQAIDIRISTCPTMKGEKIVMRILDPSISNLDVKDLGMDDLQKENFLTAIHKPQGMILVTGPTGSGKTVTLYTGLQLLNVPEKNISTIEDPVEIYMDGVNQVQVNAKVGLNFAAALRSFLRQDPDIIMVGEIRDLETAEIAIKAAQTGHLVLSTLHTNNAPQTIARLISMGIKAFNIVSSVSLVMAQRLVRKLCPKCKKKVENAEILLKEFGADIGKDTVEIYEAQGCSYCKQGFKGRIGIFEVMPVTPELNELILTGGSAIEIEKLAREQNVLSLRQSGIEQVINGLTTLEEVNQATM